MIIEYQGERVESKNLRLSIVLIQISDGEQHC